MPILGNGSSSEDFTVHSRILQDDPISPFLFLIVVEGLMRLMRNEVNLRKFKGVKVGEMFHLELLQFTDDTMVLCDRKWTNFWSLKAILNGFQMASDLSLNMNKSWVYGMITSADFLKADVTFLAFKVGNVPFVFSGLPVGPNHRKKITWNPIITKMR
ncbi:unnamed protein product [Lathyrus sativus]|nr:unnamed protein product [Lathyrus sativus]